MWLDSIEKTNPILNMFNSESIYSEKVVYANQLEEQYTILLESMKKLDPPNLGKRSHELALNSIEKRIGYFKCIKENDFEKINNIENEAYLYETMFWEEVDSIFNRLTNRATELGLGDPLNSIYLTHE
jgi:hypothetical protein